MSGERLADTCGGVSPIAIIQMGRNEKPKPEVARLAEALRHRVSRVDVISVVGRQHWWVNEGGDLFRPVERDDAMEAVTRGVIGFVDGVSP
jgi:hypothetical protein